jgi:hypothetical protein
MNDFLAFRKMLTPVIIQIVFWLGLLGILVYSFMGFDFAVAVLAIAFGAVMWRVYCEILIVVFRMLDVLTDIKNKP